MLMNIQELCPETALEGHRMFMKIEQLHFIYHQFLKLDGK